MNRPIARCLLATLAILAIPAIASATPKVGEHDNGWSITEERGLVTFERCWAALKSQCGRNIVDDGLASGKPPSDAKIREWTATMERWLNPPEPTVVESVSVSTPPAPVTSSVPSSAGGCVGMEAESGTDGYAAYNASSGAEGCYQVIPSTEAAYGCDLTTPAGQDECMARLCADGGNDHWSASGATPC